MSKPLYRIEIFCPVQKKWRIMLTWWGMQKSKAEGAFMVLKGFYGGSEAYRLVKSCGSHPDLDPGEVVDSHNTGEIKLNKADNL